MILYKGGWRHIPNRLFQYTGSTVPKSFLIALFPALAAGALKHFKPLEVDILTQTQAWSGFSFLVGFLVVFRTSQAYIRFNEGITTTHRMRAEWFDACTTIMSFTKFSKCEKEVAMRFKELFVRLVSMLNAAALTELEKRDEHSRAELWSHHYRLIDPEGIDSETLRTIKNADHRVELLFEWIQQLIVENIETGVLSIPPPLLSRTFNLLSNGMTEFHNACKISSVPMPFPYAQTCEWLLLLHTIMVPMVTSQWVSHTIWAVVFSLLQVLFLWSLNLAALEIENPFGTDDNDMDGCKMQDEFNACLKMLLAPSTERTPQLSLRFGQTPEPGQQRISKFDQVLFGPDKHSRWQGDDGATSRADGIAEEVAADAEPAAGRASTISSRASFSSDAPAQQEPPTSSSAGTSARPGRSDSTSRGTKPCTRCKAQLVCCPLDYASRTCTQCSVSIASSCEGGQREMWTCAKNCATRLCKNCACLPEPQEGLGVTAFGEIVNV